MYKFGEFLLDTENRRLFWQTGEAVPLTPRVFDLLVAFVESDGRVLTKDELMDTVWADCTVEESNLSQSVFVLRKALNETAHNPRFIRTIPAQGYRFIAPVKIENGNGFASEYTAKNGSAAIPFTARAVTEPETVPRWPDVLRSRPMIVGLVVILIAGAGAFVSQSWNLIKPSQTMTRVPGTEHSLSIALSPNGEYVAHAVPNGGKQVLTMTHVPSGSSTPILPPDPSGFLGITFAKDGNFVYFVKSSPDFNTLYRIPFLGGNVEKILDRIDLRISFSPDGSRFCFVRKLDTGTTAILIANADGSDEREISRRIPPQQYSTRSISWSPDGKLIANAAIAGGNNPDTQIVGIDVETGAEAPLTDRRWSGSDGLDWLADGSGIVAGLWEGATATTHVWLVPYPAGEPRKLTTDLENYGSVGVSADGRAIIAGQFRDNTSIWVVPGGSPDKAEPASTGRHHKFNWVRWLPDGGITFGSDAGKNRDVWRINLDGSGERMLTSGPQSNVMPVATSDGRYIVFAPFRDNNDLFELWRMDADGSNEVRLTPVGGGAWQPSLTTDGKWAFYTSGTMDGPPMQRRIWKVPVEGGEPVQFTAMAAYQAEVSPDGRFIACWIKTDEKATPKAAILPIEGGPPIKVLDTPTGNRLDWTPDGRGLSFIRTVNGVSNIWTQPIDGGEPHQETIFTSETIRNFAWSADNRLLCSRYLRTRDVMLIRNFR